MMMMMRILDMMTDSVGDDDFDEACDLDGAYNNRNQTFS